MRKIPVQLSKMFLQIYYRFNKTQADISWKFTGQPCSRLEPSLMGLLGHPLHDSVARLPVEEQGA